MTNPQVEKELLDQILGLERRYWQALKDRDVDTVMALTDDDCIVAGSQGVSAVDKKMVATMMDSPTYEIKNFDLGADPHVRLLTDDVAVVAYKVREDLTVEGKPVTFEAADASTWVRKNGKWVCCLHTESITGDPFGRDKKPPKG